MNTKKYRYYRWKHVYKPKYMTRKLTVNRYKTQVHTNTTHVYTLVYNKTY